MFFWSLQLALGYDVQERIIQNWVIDDPSNWKESEQHNPGITSFNDSCTLNNVSLICNPTQLADNSPSIVIYTDYDTQIALAKYKHANWFCTVSDKNHDQMIASYNTVKDLSWPTIETVYDILKLPQAIITELNDDFDFPISWLEDTVELPPASEFNGVQICNDILQCCNRADHVFLLQDVVKTKFKCVTDALGLEHTQEVADHVDQWVALHPENIQQMFYKDI